VKWNYAQVTSTNWTHSSCSSSYQCPLWDDFLVSGFRAELLFIIVRLPIRFKMALWCKIKERIVTMEMSWIHAGEFKTKHS